MKLKYFICFKIEVVEIQYYCGSLCVCVTRGLPLVCTLHSLLVYLVLSLFCFLSLMVLVSFLLLVPVDYKTDFRVRVPSELLTTYQSAAGRFFSFNDDAVCAFQYLFKDSDTMQYCDL